MNKEIIKKEEKKVEYLELIYDLIFVYIIGRNNSLLHHIHDGFVDSGMFIAYILCTLAVIQIWNFTTYYINIYGRNGIREHIFLFINMFLLYFVAEGTREHWQSYQNQYHLAWALILINIGTQYFIELKNHRNDEYHRQRIKRIMTILFTEALIVLSAIPIYNLTESTIMAPIAILFGIIATTISGKDKCNDIVDFTHLSERAMLYVVFTFGEMIIAIASYFEGDLNLNNLYFSAMAFLIVVGLFLSYGTIYDHIVDREMNNNGLSYMLIHIFIIFALNNITTSLEFMQNEEISLMLKISFLIISFVIYYTFLLLMCRFAKKKYRPNIKFYITMITVGVSFAGLMLLFRNMMIINIAVTVIYVFAVFLFLYKFGRKINSTVSEK